MYSFRYKSIIDARKEILQLAKREKSYTDSITEKTEKLAKIDQRLADVRQDDSRAARIEEASLLEERKELAKEIADEQNDHYVEVTEDALDDELDQFEKTKNAEIKEIEAFLKDQERLNREAMNRLDNMNQALFETLKGYVLKYTETSSEEFEKMWNDALAAARMYGSYTSALTETGKEIDESSVSDLTVPYLVGKMRDNAAAWHTATTAKERDDLESENDRIAAIISEMLNKKVTRGTDGVWYVDGKPLFAQYSKDHTGTPSVGTIPTVKQNETWSMLQDKEMVQTQQRQESLWSMLKSWAPLTAIKDALPKLSMFSRAGNPAQTSIVVEAPIHMTGDLNAETLRVLKNHPYVVADIVSQQLKKM